MPRPKKPDPEFQRITLTLDSETIYAMQEAIELHYDRRAQYLPEKYDESIERHNGVTADVFNKMSLAEKEALMRTRSEGSFKELSKEEQKQVMSEYIKDIVRHDYDTRIESTPHFGFPYSVAIRNYHEEQAKKTEYWSSIDNDS